MLLCDEQDDLSRGCPRGCRNAVVEVGREEVDVSARGPGARAIGQRQVADDLRLSPCRIYAGSRSCERCSW